MERCWRKGHVITFFGREKEEEMKTPENHLFLASTYHTLSRIIFYFIHIIEKFVIFSSVEQLCQTRY